MGTIGEKNYDVHIKKKMYSQIHRGMIFNAGIINLLEYFTRMKYINIVEKYVILYLKQKEVYEFTPNL